MFALKTGRATVDMEVHVQQTTWFPTSLGGSVKHDEIFADSVLYLLVRHNKKEK